MNMEWLTSGRAAALSLLTGGPSLVWAAVNDDWMPVAVGVCTGTVLFWWTAKKASDDQRLKSILDRLDKAEQQNAKYQDEITEVRSSAARIMVELEEIKAKHQRLVQRLTAHICPVPADPAVKCRLAEIIGE